MADHAMQWTRQPTGHAPGWLGRVRRDVDSGIASGQVQGTPTLFIDGVVHRGSYDAATLMEALAG